MLAHVMSETDTRCAVLVRADEDPRDPRDPRWRVLDWFDGPDALATATGLVEVLNGGEAKRAELVHALQFLFDNTRPVQGDGDAVRESWANVARLTAPCRIAAHGPRLDVNGRAS